MSVGKRETLEILTWLECFGQVDRKMDEEKELDSDMESPQKSYLASKPRTIGDRLETADDKDYMLKMISVSNVGRSEEWLTHGQLLLIANFVGVVVAEKGR